MAPLFCTIGSLALAIIPDTQAHLNGHVIITHTYSIFLKSKNNNAQLMRSRESVLHLEINPDPDYFGYITFEMPDKLFSYTADGARELVSDEVEQLIEFLSDYRNNPGLWKNWSV
jgi:hypothetical protein